MRNSDTGALIGPSCPRTARRCTTRSYESTWCLPGDATLSSCAGTSVDFQEQADQGAEDEGEPDHEHEGRGDDAPDRERGRVGGQGRGRRLGAGSVGGQRRAFLGGVGAGPGRGPRCLARASPMLLSMWARRAPFVWWATWSSLRVCRSCLRSTLTSLPSAAITTAAAAAAGPTRPMMTDRSRPAMDRATTEASRTQATTAEAMI